MTPTPTSRRPAMALRPCSPQQQPMLVALCSWTLNCGFAARNGYPRRLRFRGRIEIGHPLSRQSRHPTFNPNPSEGRASMRRIIAAVAALVALVLGGGAGYLGY